MKSMIEGVKKDGKKGRRNDRKDSWDKDGFTQRGRAEKKPVDLAKIQGIQGQIGIGKNKGDGNRLDCGMDKEEAEDGKDIMRCRHLSPGGGGMKRLLSEDVRETEGIGWESLGLGPVLLKRIRDIGYDFPSPVQVASIPHVLGGKNLLVRSKNGTGKTASYIVPMLNMINSSELSIQGIILVPIRELALQISRNVKRMSEGTGVISAPVVGGTSMQDDIIRVSNGVHVMVGTPGRIVDLVEKRVGTLSKRVILVFDEADKLLDVTFGETVTKLLDLLPREKQMLLYSATFPYFVTGFIRRYMKNPLCINLMKELAPVGVKQFYTYVKPSEKLLCLKSLLLRLSINQCVIFCNSIKTVELLAMKITEMGLPSYFIHSKMAQEDRNIVFHNFLKGKCKILVATDLITRGVDAPNTNYVINFDISKSPESYLHRIGRAGRFGAPGVAISLVTTEEKEMLMDIEAKLGKEISPLSDKGLSRLHESNIDRNQG
ncbi:putative ATP-DEPENDENT RNA HELICASE (DEAD box family) [Encephalitozoon cuniculi GB-M1]|uniref:ATP-dependent RNA helicase DHH1 n=2 Tax=Encephalitozoon cuniculi TaxID=6035 RepID=DHH1_ENCCU|nr:ATP-dependent RNA helicase [Encephalitozoon cuniculi GB-M1]Q8SQK9.2 RecName: Full=ATP-dependent RNA helicase DHH1 [Encephalitozoon cuniculi GB-M1]KMV65344.1 ATP-dependent RNA helicase [Encephalitozoon cuniculi EcunIII-L]UYI26858.1 DEAD box RNA helicase [Encephalitozoon cuniculi]CAD27136.2 putative ATP-DEPENDENT RNA HELICASE (DEAD box family) [Encephalitozoon cuniculi GB-M1]